MTLRDEVQRYYGERVTRAERCCAPQVGGMVVPSFGCGAPTEFADLKPGETVLDLGSGAGLDCFRAAEKVGETGRVVGVDMTAAMLARARARRGAARLGLTQVEFREGYIEALPVETASIDAVISNCVVNLSTDKDAVFAEAYRVLKPGGRVALSDMVRAAVRASQPEHVTEAGWCACEDGAEDVPTYRARLRKAGFVGATVGGDAPPEGVYSARVQATKPLIRAATEGDSATVRELLDMSGLPLAGLEHTHLWVSEADQTVTGVVGFERYETSALLRSLAVVPEYRGRGLGEALLHYIFTQLKADGVTDAYGLTTTVLDWLLCLGFAETTRDALPPELARSEQLQGACPASARVFYRVL